MGIDWCPLEADWGNWAEWAAVVATVGVGVAVGLMTRRTNQLAEAANRANAAAAKAAKEREDAAAQLQATEQRLLLISMAAPIGIAWAAADAIDQAMRMAGAVDQVIGSERVRQAFQEQLSIGEFVIPESVRDRLHFVDQRVAASILRSERAFPMLRTSLTMLPHTLGDVQRGMAESFALGVRGLANEAKAAWDACDAASREVGLRMPPAPPVGEIAVRPD